MSRRARSSDMRHKVGVYNQKNVIDKETKDMKQVWVHDHDIWCSESTTFREQLEMDASGATNLRNRKEFETRYPTKLTTRNRVVFNGQMYRVSIVGDTSGTHDRVRFIGERLEDGGA